MVLQAVLNIKDYTKGASRQAIKKYIETNYKTVGQQSALRKAIAAAVQSGVLLQEGQRFRLTKEKRAEMRKPAPKPKK
jgi:predicted thioesterase